MTRAQTCGGILAGSLLLGGCGRDVQSVMAPKGVQAGQIAELAWLLFGFGVFVLAIVIVAVWLAIGGSPRVRRALAQEKAIWALGVVFPVATLTLLLGYGVWLMRSDLDLARDGNAISIEIVGEQWWW